MSFLSNLFTTSAETRENPQKNTLKTKYYRNDQKKVVEAVQQLSKEVAGFRVLHTNQSETEVTFEFRGKAFSHDVVVTLFKITPVQTAVDIFSASRVGLPDFGANEKIIQQIYAYLDSKLTPIERPR